MACTLSHCPGRGWVVSDVRLWPTTPTIIMRPIGASFQINKGLGAQCHQFIFVSIRSHWACVYNVSDAPNFHLAPKGPNRESAMSALMDHTNILR